MSKDEFLLRTLMARDDAEIYILLGDRRPGSGSKTLPSLGRESLCTGRGARWSRRRRRETHSIRTIDFDDPDEGADAEAELLDAVADIGCYHRVKIEASYDRTVEINEPRELCPNYERGEP